MQPGVRPPPPAQPQVACVLLQPQPDAAPLAQLQPLHEHLPSAHLPLLQHSGATLHVHAAPPLPPHLLWRSRHKIQDQRSTKERAEEDKTDAPQRTNIPATVAGALLAALGGAGAARRADAAAGTAAGGLRAAAGALALALAVTLGAVSAAAARPAAGAAAAATGAIVAAVAAAGAGASEAARESVRTGMAGENGAWLHLRHPYQSAPQVHLPPLGPPQQPHVQLSPQLPPQALRARSGHRVTEM